MVRLLIVTLVVACSGEKQAPYVDVWTTRSLEPFSATLVEEVAGDAAKVPFTIDLPQGMFHDPRSGSKGAQYYGVWRSDGLQDPDTPGAAIRLAPNGPTTLDAFVADEASGEEVVAKTALPDGTLTMTTRRGKHAWRVNQVRVTRDGHAVHCSAWRHDNGHELGEPSRLMVEKICGSLHF